MADEKGEGRGVMEVCNATNFYDAMIVFMVLITTGIMAWWIK